MVCHPFRDRNVRRFARRVRGPPPGRPVSVGPRHRNTLVRARVRSALERRHGIRQHDTRPGWLSGRAAYRPCGFRRSHGLPVHRLRSGSPAHSHRPFWRYVRDVAASPRDTMPRRRTPAAWRVGPGSPANAVVVRGVRSGRRHTPLPTATRIRPRTWQGSYARDRAADGRVRTRRRPPLLEFVVCYTRGRARCGPPTGRAHA